MPPSQHTHTYTYMQMNGQPKNITQPAPPSVNMDRAADQPSSRETAHRQRQLTELVNCVTNMT